MMNRLRSDSAWTRLTGAQLTKLESWLFEQHLSHRETLELVGTEFGLKTSLTSLKMFYRRLAKEREERREAEDLRALIDPKKAGGPTLEQLREAGEKMTALNACRLGMESPPDAYKLAALCRAMTRQQQAELQRRKLNLLERQAQREGGTGQNQMPEAARLPHDCRKSQLKSG